MVSLRQLLVVGLATLVHVECLTTAYLGAKDTIYSTYDVITSSLPDATKHAKKPASVSDRQYATIVEAVIQLVKNAMSKDPYPYKYVVSNAFIPTFEFPEVVLPEVTSYMDVVEGEIMTGINMLIDVTCKLDEKQISDQLCNRGLDKFYTKIVDYLDRRNVLLKDKAVLLTMGEAAAFYLLLDREFQAAAKNGRALPYLLSSEKKIQELVERAVDVVKLMK